MTRDPDPVMDPKPVHNGGKTGTTTPMGNGGTGGTSVTQPLPGIDVAGPAPLRRLTIAEYNNTVRDLLGTDMPVIGPSDGFAADLQAWDKGFLRGATVGSSNDARLYLDFSDKISTAAMSHLATLLPQGCGTPAAAAEDGCAKKFIEQFGLRAYRRPLSTDEQGELLALYTRVRATDIGLTFPEAVRALISGILQSPMFTYRWELGVDPTKDGDLVRLNDYEMASRLSYMTIASMPDAPLFAAAAAGQLNDPAVIEQQVRRLLASAGAKAGLSEFITQWLNVTSLLSLDKDPNLTNYTPAVAQAMLKETGMFFSAIMQGPTGKLEELFTSSASFVDAPLAKLYGVTGVTGTAAQQVTMNPAQRAGLLTQASFLAMHATVTDSHPVRRGATVLRRLFCTEIEPPANMDVGQPKPPADGVTTRDRFSVHSMQQCATCHRATDPLGFAFENYDAIGGWRTMDQNKAVDASGSVTLNKTEVKFANAVELMKALATADEVRSCVTTQWLRYFVRRDEVPGDEASLQSANAAFKKSSYDIRELLVALARTPAFTHRLPSVGEMVP